MAAGYVDNGSLTWLFVCKMQRQAKRLILEYCAGCVAGGSGADLITLSLGRSQLEGEVGKQLKRARVTIITEAARGPGERCPGLGRSAEGLEGHSGNNDTFRE